MMIGVSKKMNDEIINDVKVHIKLILDKEHIHEVFEILCEIPFEVATMNDIEPPTSRHPGIEQIIEQLQCYIVDDELSGE